MEWSGMERSGMERRSIDDEHNLYNEMLVL